MNISTYSIKILSISLQKITTKNANAIQQYRISKAKKSIKIVYVGLDFIFSEYTGFLEFQG